MKKKGVEISNDVPIIKAIREVTNKENTLPIKSKLTLESNGSLSAQAIAHLIPNEITNINPDHYLLMLEGKEVLHLLNKRHFNSIIWKRFSYIHSLLTPSSPIMSHLLRIIDSDRLGMLYARENEKFVQLRPDPKISEILTRWKKARVNISAIQDNFLLALYLWELSDYISIFTPVHRDYKDDIWNINYWYIHYLRYIAISEIKALDLILKSDDKLDDILRRSNPPDSYGITRTDVANTLKVSLRYWKDLKGRLANIPMNIPIRRVKRRPSRFWMDYFLFVVLAELKRSSIPTRWDEILFIINRFWKTHNGELFNSDILRDVYKHTVSDPELTASWRKIAHLISTSQKNQKKSDENFVKAVEVMFPFSNVPSTPKEIPMMTQPERLLALIPLNDICFSLKGQPGSFFNLI